ncbi:TonB-dependent receptor plug domain-containing protein [Aurantiacibacter spongiae]|uniref:TonB-dependent receptor n=1 Tax=Aurantiacibacter spongiae TaxID=2488860 RepID=A0A3N5DNP3_9SPHN|nr:TonB-dependent receptor [Aurantiacibacter spongiae]RPF70691.1 TonB-dependent receptor [Aurantiacibacter spongiae]
MRKYLILGASALSLAVPAAAQDAGSPCEDVASASGFCPTPEDTITVTATGTRTSVDATGQAVTVLGRNEIVSLQTPDLTRVLERVPGLTVTRNGGVGGFTGVRLRGSEAEQVLVIVDGVRVADPASPAGGYDFGNLLASDIDKLDVLRGSNSTIWGSDAVGGVILASTLQRTGLDASAQYGSDDTFSGRLAGGLSDADTGYIGASATYFGTDGFSAAAAGTEPDGFEQWALNGHARYYFSDQFELFARARYAEGELDIDGTPPPLYALADTPEYQDTRHLAASAGAVYDTGPLFLQGAYSFADTARDNYDPASGDAPTFTSDGRSDRVEVRGEWRPFGPLLVNFGAENEWTSYRTAYDAGEETRIFGAYAQGGIEWRGINAHLGARFTDHADFGSAVSFGGDASYGLGDGWRVRASVGEGFKAPSLFQLYSDYGNLALQPEESTSVDVGLAYGTRALEGTDTYAALTLFRRDTDDQIAFVSCFGRTDAICEDRPFGTYENVGRTRAQGIEFESWVRAGSGVTLGALYAFTDTENRSPGSAEAGNRLARRPRFAATFTGEWTPLARLTLGADLRIVTASFDDAANTVRLDGYETLALRAALGLTERVQVFGRVENVWDEDYQTAAGYATQGRAVHVGARLAL